MLLAALAALAPATALAHPGHGMTDPETWVHYLTEPVHVLTLAAAASVAVTTTIGWRRSRARPRLPR